MQVFARENSLACSEVRVHAVPSSREGAAVENHEKTVFIRIDEDVFIKLHGHLLVSAEEVNLDSAYADALHPCHLLAAVEVGVHPVLGALRRVGPIDVRVVPQIEVHTLLLSIFRKLRDAVIAYLSVPEGVNED